MSQVPPSPEAGVASALSDLSEQTLELVRREVEAAQQEIIAKAKRWLPAAGLLGVAGVAGVFATASSYRLVMRVIDKVLPPATAALFATAAFGGLAAWAATTGVKKVRDLPPPVPTETARAAGRAVSEATGG